MSSILGISCAPNLSPSGTSFRVVVTYDYSSDAPGRLRLEADVPADAGERIQIAPPLRSCEKGEGKEATFSLRIDIPAEWKSGRYSVKLTAKLSEGGAPSYTLRRLAACFVEKP